MRLFLSLLLLTLSTALHADWNQSFDEVSHRLTQQLTPLQHRDYKKQYSFFVKTRKKLLTDKKVFIKITSTPPEKKRLIIKEKEKLIIKKRRHNHMHDLYVWELSYLFGPSDCIVPSFPVDIGGKRAIVQRIEPLGYADTIPPEDLEKITVETYWKAHIQAYLLGLSDLAGRNIGISPEGKIRFFDNEASFIYYNKPVRTARSFSSGFLCQSFDWPQYRTPLDDATVASLQAFVQSLSHLEEQIRLYCTMRPLQFPAEPFLYRLEKLRSFQIRKGLTFRDFFKAAFPQIAPGFTKLNEIVSDILQEKVGDGTTLFFICRRMTPSHLSEKHQKAIRDWVNTYIDPPQN